MKVFAISFLMLKQDASSSIATHTLQMRSANSEQEAVGLCMKDALEAKPGFSISGVLTLEVAV